MEIKFDEIEVGDVLEVNGDANSLETVILKEGNSVVTTYSGAGGELNSIVRHKNDEDLIERVEPKTPDKTLYYLCINNDGNVWEHLTLFDEVFSIGSYHKPITAIKAFKKLENGLFQEVDFEKFGVDKNDKIIWLDE